MMGSDSCFHGKESWALVALSVLCRIFYGQDTK